MTTKSLNNEVFTCLLLCARFEQEESRPPDEVELAAKHPTMEADDDMGE